MGKHASLSILGVIALLLIGAVACAAMIGVRAQSGGGPLVLMLGHSMDQNHPVHLALERMRDRVAEESAGALLIRIAPNGQLGGETECVSLVQRGALAMQKVSATPLENFIPEMAVFSVPYLFVDEAHFWRTLHSSVGEGLLSAGNKVGLHGLCYYDAGARSFYTTSRPILKPADLRGLLIRVQESPTSIAMVEALGGSPTPVDFGELYTALQQAVVDGAENNPPSFYLNRHYEVCKAYSLDEHTRSPDLLMISQVWWRRLSPEQQQLLSRAAKESAEYERQLWKEQTARSLEGMEEKGVQVYHPDKKLFRQQVQGMIAGYNGTKIGEIIHAIQALGESP